MRINMCDGDAPAPAVRIVPLHERWDLVEPCAELLNTQWQRSMGARLHGLRQSSNGYPVNLVLLEGDELIGHARLSRVLGSRSLFVESVVVQPGLRGKGYGRLLMEGVERYARGRGCTRLYLTTHDKQHFYAHLGFVPSRPVQNVGTLASLMPMELLHKFCRTSESEGAEAAARPKTPPLPLAPPTQSKLCNSLSSSLHLPPTPPPPPPLLSFKPSVPPPAPPPPPLTLQAPPLLSSQPSVPPPPPSAPPPLSSQLTGPPPPPTPPAPPTPPFSSQLSAPPPPPSVPPPHSSKPSALPPVPPPPPPSSWTPVDQTLEQTPYTDNRGLPVFWMHKDI